MASNLPFEAVAVHVDTTRTNRSDGSSPWDFSDSTEVGITDAELTALALADEGEPQLGENAVPIFLDIGHYQSMLSAWYMPPTSTRHISGWRKPVVLGIVATLVVLEALGLCSIFGQVVIG